MLLFEAVHSFVHPCNTYFILLSRPELSFWIGLSQNELDEWIWADNTTLTWENWNTMDTVQIQPMARLCATATDLYPCPWNIEACSRRLHSLCQYESGMKFYLNHICTLTSEMKATKYLWYYCFRYLYLSMLEP